MAATVVALGLALAGCSGPGGGGSGGTGIGATSAGSGTGSPATGGGASGTTQAHWQAALAALGPGAPWPAAPTLDPAAIDAWNRLWAQGWHRSRAILDPLLQGALQGRLAGLASGSVAIQGVRNLTIDTSAPPAFEGSGAPPSLTFAAHIPAAPGAWSFSFTMDVGTTLRTSIAGIPIAAQISIPVVAEVFDIRIDDAFFVDVSNPAQPRLSGSTTPQLSLGLRFSSPDPLFQQVAGTVTQVLDPIIRAALFAGALYVQQEISNFISTVPQTPWGLGAQPAAGVPGAPALGALSEQISDEIQRFHLPYGTLVGVIFDQPGYGNGSPVDYTGFGDSAIWTGHYVLSEALRYDLTGDPRALAGAERGLRGLRGCVEVGGNTGLLARAIVPVGSPHFAGMQSRWNGYTGTVNGVLHAAEGDISRDQYLGAFLAGFGTWLRVPQLRAEARDLVSRMVDYLDAHQWHAYVTPTSPQPSRASPMAQTPAVVFAFTKAGFIVDPVRFGPLHDRWKDVTSVIWLGAWLSSREVHESYYKFNLGHAQLVLLATAETDPARYRDYAKELEIVRGAIGHHDNAWFDAVYGACVPAQAPAMGPRVRNALERWTLRSRRGFTVLNSQDPSIASVHYASGAMIRNPGGGMVAVQPIPIEKRPHTDYLWQRSCFQLDGQDPETEQSPGVDLLLPYWMARSYGMIP